MKSIESLEEDLNENIRHRLSNLLYEELYDKVDETLVDEFEGASEIQMFGQSDEFLTQELEEIDNGNSRRHGK